MKFHYCLKGEKHEKEQNGHTWLLQILFFFFCFMIFHQFIINFKDIWHHQGKLKLKWILRLLLVNLRNTHTHKNLKWNQRKRCQSNPPSGNLYYSKWFGIINQCPLKPKLEIISTFLTPTLMRLGRLNPESLWQRATMVTNSILRGPLNLTTFNWCW